VRQSLLKPKKREDLKNRTKPGIHDLFSHASMASTNAERRATTSVPEMLALGGSTRGTTAGYVSSPAEGRAGGEANLTWQAVDLAQGTLIFIPQKTRRNLAALPTLAAQQWDRCFVYPASARNTSASEPTSSEISDRCALCAAVSTGRLRANAMALPR
jgi:hypothetical protein